MIMESKMNYREKRREMEDYKEGQWKITADRTDGQREGTKQRISEIF